MANRNLGSNGSPQGTSLGVASGATTTLASTPHVSEAGHHRVDEGPSGLQRGGTHQLQGVPVVSFHGKQARYSEDRLVVNLSTLNKFVRPKKLCMTKWWHRSNYTSDGTCGWLHSISRMRTGTSPSPRGFTSSWSSKWAPTRFNLSSPFRL